MTATPEFSSLVVGAGLLAGTANVIMQLALPAVGYGVVESKVESGQIFRHPVKRTRTTLAYLAVVGLGTAQERELFRRGVNRAHAQVRSDATSPVAYNAFDPELQLWVAACLWKGFEDTYAVFGTALPTDTMELLYQEAAALGTTLQLPRDRWPADRAAFARYWAGALDRISIDDRVRDYLTELAKLRFLPRPVSLLLGPFHQFVTTGFLSQRFRTEMRLPWTPRQQRRFDRLMAVLGAFTRRLPPTLRRFPYNAVLHDLRKRVRDGRPLV